MIQSIFVHMSCINMYDQAKNNDATAPPPHKGSSIKTATSATISPAEKEECPSAVQPAERDVVSPLEPSPTKEPSPAHDTALFNEKTPGKETPDPPQMFKEKLLQKALPSLPAEKTTSMDNNNNGAIPKVRIILLEPYDYNCSLAYFKGTTSTIAQHVRSW